LGAFFLTISCNRYEAYLSIAIYNAAEEEGKILKMATRQWNT